MAVIALDLGGTKLAAGVLSTHGRVLDRRTFLVENSGGDQVGQIVCNALRSCLEFASRRKVSIQGIGVSVPGISSPRGRVWAPNIRGWTDYPLGAKLRAAAEPFDFPVLIDNDRACYILGESWLGAARGCRNALFFSVGTGVAAGVMIDGRIVRGAHGTAGSIGWMALDRHYRPEYRTCGCFEFHASGAGLAREARRRFRVRAGHASRPAGTPPGTADLFAAYKSKEPMATKIVTDAVAFWGMGIANLISAFDPEVIVFGGGVFGPARSLLKAIRAEAARWAQPIAMRKVKFCDSQLGSDAGLVGAGYLALRADANQVGFAGRV